MCPAVDVIPLGIVTASKLLLTQVEMNHYRAEVDQSCECVVPILGICSACGGNLEAAHARARCREFLQSPPGEDWEAANAMKMK